MLDVDTLSAELERLYDLSELEAIGKTLLGLDAGALGGGAKAPVARGLAERCVERDAVEALLDAMQETRRDEAKALRKKNAPNGHISENDLASAGYTLVGDVGVGPNATVHRAYFDGDLLRLKIVRGTRRSDAQRYLVATRLAGAVMHPGLPEAVVARQIGSSFAVAHPFVEGETLRASLKRTGPRHVNEMLALFYAVAEALAALHERRLVHGALHLGNVLVVDPSTSSARVLLLDAGAHLLRPNVPQSPDDPSRTWISARSPEALRGRGVEPASDVYAFGVMVYQVLTGKDPFAGPTAADVAAAHLTSSAEPLTFAAPGVGPDIDAFVLSLLERDPENRPRDGTELGEIVRRVWRASTRPPSWVSDDRLEGRFAVLAENPNDEAEAAALEASVDIGADALKIAEGFTNTVTVIQERGVAGAATAVPKLLTRAARLYESAGRFDEAEGLYERVVELDRGDASSFAALVRVKRRLGRFEALVELFLERSESAESPSERAECFAEIGELYANQLSDKDQAIVAFAQAFCEDPLSDERARAIERISAGNPKAWAEVLERVSAAKDGDFADEARAALCLKGAEWYMGKLSRPDQALVLLDTVIAREPGNDAALSALADIYRRSQQWTELGQVLVRRADVAAPRLARDLRAEAADVLASRLGNDAGAEEMLQAVIFEDPGHARAGESLAKILRNRGEQRRALEVLEARALAQTGEEKRQQILQLAEAWESELDRLDIAERLYRSVLADEPKHLDALRGLDRVLNRAGRYRELVDVLKDEIDLAMTPRQKVGLYERLAGIYDEEYLDPAKAAESLEQALILDASRSSAATELARHYRRLERFTDLRDLYKTQLDTSTDKTWRIEAGLALARLLDEHFGLWARAIEELDRVLELSPDHPGALGAMASLRARSGDSENALAAIERLADAAATPQERAEHYLRAADLMLKQGDSHSAIRELKRALDAVPRHAAAEKKLIQAYVDAGQHGAAVELLEEKLEKTEGARARAELAGQIALLCFRYLNDDERALAMAQVALHLDPTNLDALRVQGRVAYGDARFVEAAKRLEAVVAQADALPEDELADTVFAYIDSLAKSDATDRALGVADQHIDVLAASASSLVRLAEISSEHGSPRRTIEIVERLVGEHEGTLSPNEEALGRRLAGLAHKKLGSDGHALAELDRSMRLDPEARPTLQALAALHVELGDFRSAIDVRRRDIELAEGDERVSALVELGEMVADKLGDNDYAGRCFLMALGEAPNDRRILARLMQLFSAEKNWSQLLEVVTRLAHLVDDTKQKAKYLHTAAMVAAREIGDADQALHLLDKALEVDPRHEGALSEALAIRRRQGDWDGIKDLLKNHAQELAKAGRNAELLVTLEELGEIYERLSNVEQAARVYESALEVEPDGVRWLARLARAYASDPAHSGQARDALAVWIDVDPYQPEPYQILRRVHTEARHADGAWCACQALRVLGQAQPDESRFFARFRSTELVPARRRMTQDEFMELVMPADGEPHITALFSLIEPYVLAARGRPESSYGLGPEDELDMERYPHGLVYAFYHGAQVLPADEPRTYQRQSDSARVTPLMTRSPAVILGKGAFAQDMGELESAFIAGVELTHTLPGLRLRTMLPNVTALKAWLLGAIRLLKPKFPVSPELEDSVNEATNVVRERSIGEYRDHLVHTVGRLLQDGAALDLKRWVRAVDQAADRSGLILCGDLEIAAAVARREPGRPGAVEPGARARDLLVYSVSPAHVAVRERLGIGVEA
jgi:tetratricopeptide (TPR) repeat protein